MKCVLLVLMLIGLVTAKESLNKSIEKIHKNFEEVKAFCMGKDRDFCSKAQIRMSLNVLQTKLKELERLQKEFVEEERKRRVSKKIHRQMRIKLAINFMDRHF
jgi:tRNA uridine 5-carbamoylmethylation protein Kti12